jgi:hypothetical protein
MLFTLTTTHMPAIGWRLCVDGVEIVWRLHLRHPLDTDATRQETAAARIAKVNLATCCHHASTRRTGHLPAHRKPRRPARNGNPAPIRARPNPTTRHQ